MNLQTCRRHPGPRFLRTCPGCAQELYDAQARNEAIAAARKALAAFAGPTVRILDARYLPGGRLAVATQDPARAFEFGVDVFRLPIAAETDAECVDPVPADVWLLADQWGAYDQAEHAQQWTAAIRQYTPRINLAA